MQQGQWIIKEYRLANPILLNCTEKIAIGQLSLQSLIQPHNVNNVEEMEDRCILLHILTHQIGQQQSSHRSGQNRDRPHPDWSGPRVSTSDGTPHPVHVTAKKWVQ